MCGIGGIRRYGNTPIYEWQLRMLATSLEYRGKDATGFALMTRSGVIGIYKDPEPAWKVTGSKAYFDWMRENLTPDVHIALVHTRKYTKGSPFKNENNHPISAGDGAVTHNGWINNDDELFKERAFKRSCDTDSDVIRALLDQHGQVDERLFKIMSALDGVAAIAAIHPSSPDKLLLLRDNADLILGDNGDQLVFASDKRAINQALKPWVKRHNILMQIQNPNVAYLPFPNGSGWILGAEGLEAHGEFSCSKWFRARTVYAPTTDFHERRRRAQQEAAKPVIKATIIHPANTEGIRFIICPECFVHVELDEDQQKVPLDYLKCLKCDTVLSRALEATVTN